MGKQHNNSIDIYISDTERFPRLSEEEEQQLAREIERDIAIIANPGEDDQSAANAAENMLNSQDKLVTSNLRFAVNLAGRYLWGGVPKEDLVQEASGGMTHAVKHYRSGHEAKFITFAHLPARGNMLKLIAHQGRFFKIPINYLTTSLKINRLNREADAKGEPRPSIDELAEKIAVEAANRQADANGESRPSMGELAEKIAVMAAKIKKIFSIPVVLPSHLVKEDDGEWGYSRQEGVYQETPLDTTIQRERERIVLDAFKGLTRREEKAIRMRFGIGYQSEHTLKEIGHSMGVGAERARQIEAEALRKLRYNPRIKEEREYLVKYKQEVRS